MSRPKPGTAHELVANGGHAAADGVRAGVVYGLGMVFGRTHARTAAMVSPARQMSRSTATEVKGCRTCKSVAPIQAAEVTSCDGCGDELEELALEEVDLWSAMS